MGEKEEKYAYKIRGLFVYQRQIWTKKEGR